MKGRDQQGNW